MKKIITKNYNNIFNYNIIISNKRKRTIALRLENGEVNVYSPFRFNEDIIINLLEKNLNFIIAKINEKNELQNKIYFLGEKYEINVLESRLIKNVFIERKENILFFYKPKIEEIDIDLYIIQWKKQECYKYIYDRILYFINKYEFNFNINKNKITIKEQKTKWGSCSSKCNLNFNYKIIEKSPDVVDYLIIHELSHTIYMNHSINFWNYIEKILPNYKDLEKKLKK